MNDKVWSLFVAIDKIFGGDGNPKRIAADIRKIERQDLFSRQAIWQKNEQNTFCAEQETNMQGMCNSLHTALSSEDAYRAFKYFTDVYLDNIPDFTYVIDVVENREKFVSEDVFGKLLGYPSELQSFQNWADFVVHPDDLPAHQKRLEKFRSTDRPITVRYRARNAAGNWCWIEDTSQCFSRDPSGSPRQTIGFSSVIDRITEQN